MTVARPTALPTAAAPPMSAVPPAGARVVWAGDRLTTADEAVVPALDHGLTVGDGVFESVKVTDAGPFALTLHLERLARSARGTGLPAPEEHRVRDAVEQVLAGIAGAGGPGGAPSGPAGAPWVLRLTWTAGPGPLSSSRPTPTAAGGDAGSGTLIAAAAPVAPPSPTTTAATVAWTRNERSAVAGLKTTSYAENVVALRRAQSLGATEALMANTVGDLCEGTGSNVVLALPEHPGELLTPPLTSGCLAGITRALLLAWADQEGLVLREEPVPMAALARAEEVLLLSSLRDVQAVTSLDGRALPVGELGRRAAELFARRAAADPDPRP